MLESTADEAYFGYTDSKALMVSEGEKLPAHNNPVALSALLSVIPKSSMIKSQKQTTFLQFVWWFREFDLLVALEEKSVGFTVLHLLPVAVVVTMCS